MRKFKTAQKGFTLMELIIVLALFSVIMVLVMSFIDPASKLMNKTSTREKTAAYVDNINEYVDKSLRYASFVRIFESNFCSKTAPTPIAEDKAVQEFIDDFFDGAVVSDGSPVTGRVHVLKLLNEPDKDNLTAASTYDGVAGTDLKDGVLVDVVYNFTAGDSKPKTEFDGSVTRDLTGRNAVISATPVSNQLAVNPEHFQHYSYYYRLGFNEFIPVSDRTVTTNNPKTASGSYDASLITKSDGTANLYVPTSGAIPIKSSNESDFYYKELIPMRDNTGNPMVLNKYSFAVTTVAYPNDAKGDHKVFCEKTYADDDSVTERTAIFKSPCYIATSSMAFANINPSIRYNTTCVMQDQDESGNPKANSSLIQVVTYDDSFSRYAASMPNPAQNTSNIFFIYVVPSEINN